MISPTRKRSRIETLNDLFARAKFIPETRCRIWIRGLDTPGYGQCSFKYQGKIQAAHRASYILSKGNIPKNKWVLHKCDNRACISPEHLFIGDTFINQRDSAKKGRCAGQKKTHCPQGHKYTPETTVIWHPSPGRSKRACRICKQIRDRVRKKHS
jgi:HNH endonuclease